MIDHTLSCDHCRHGDHSQTYEVCACCRTHVKGKTLSEEKN